MGRFLLIIVILIAVVVAFGFYQGWFHFSSNNSGDSSAITLTVDRAKLNKDEKFAQDKAHAIGNEVKSKVAPASAPAKKP
jgi:hypothetical protein